MIIDIVLKNRIGEAGEVLSISPVDEVCVDVPTLRRNDVLHPLVGEVGTLLPPVEFHVFALSAFTDATRHWLTLRPQEGLTVGEVLATGEAYRKPPRRFISGTGFSALQACIGVDDGLFELFGISEQHPPVAIVLPPVQIVNILLSVVSGQIIAKSSQVITENGGI